MIRLENITKRYRDRAALNHVNVTVGERRICGLWGRNGAGKTTLLRVAAGLLTPDEGTVRVLETDPAKDWKIRREIGIAEEGEAYFPELSVDEFLWWIGKLRACEGATCQEQTLKYTRQLGIEDRRHHAIGSLSHGMRRKVTLAGAMMGQPRLLILDEPTNALDVDSIRALCRLLNEHRTSGGSALLASHDALFMRAVCDDVVEMEQGTVVQTEKAADSNLLDRVLGYLQENR